MREKRRWKAGTKLTVEERPEGLLLKPLEKKRYAVADWRGMLKYDGPARTIEEMNAAIEEEAIRL